MTDRTISGVLRGSFTATGQSGELNVSDRGTLDLDFGSGSVTLERQAPNGKWCAVKDAVYTADVAVNIEGRGKNFRLNCTSFTTEIFYALTK